MANTVERLCASAMSGFGGDAALSLLWAILRRTFSLA